MPAHDTDDPQADPKPKGDPKKPQVAPVAPEIRNAGADLDSYAKVEITKPKEEIPQFAARVIYLGNNPSKSVSLPGTMYVKRQLDRNGVTRELKTPTDAGVECYDFSSLDAVGDPVEERLVPPTVKDKTLHYKPCLRVEHAEHLRWFALSTENGMRAFDVRVPDHQRRSFQEYLISRGRADANQFDRADAAFVAEVVKEG